MRKQKSQFMYFYKNSDSPFLTLQNYLVLEKKKAGINVIEKQKHRNRKIIIYTVIYVVVLISFTTYVLLDTFVIERGYQIIDKNNNSFYDSVYEKKEDNSEDNASSESNESSVSNENTESAENSGESSESDGISELCEENIAIRLNTYRENDTTIYVADIQISDIQYLKSAFAKNIYGKNVTASTSSIAESCNAQLAINGDYYGAQNDGYVIRNGTLYRGQSRSDSQEDLVIYKDGSFDIIKEGDITAEKLLEQGALQVYSFGPALIDEGEISVTEGDEVGKAMASNPRTAIGMISPLHYVMVVADGRTAESTGLSLYELAEFMESLDVEIAYNLDGGGSSTMYYQGRVINNPTTNGKRISERGVSDIVYIG